MLARRREGRTTTGAGQRAGGCSRGGFTLIELLVVIGIAVLLLAMMVPTGKAMREGNRAMACKSQLMQIGQAMKAYYADEGGAPPFYIDTGQAWGTDDPHGAGLMALYDLGYLNRRESLHCPRDIYVDGDTPEYYQSYQRRDEDVDTSSGTDLDAWSYLNSRGVTDQADLYYRRQLQPAAIVGAAPPVPVIHPDFRPADDTVITWCPFHTDYLRSGDVGDYQVLFWDGSVVRIPEDIMCDPSIAPDAPWKVGHDDGIE